MPPKEKKKQICYKKSHLLKNQFKLHFMLHIKFILNSESYEIKSKLYEL